MSSTKYILAVDQGTSSTKSLIFDAAGQAVCKASEPLQTHYLANGFVEQNAEDIYQNVLISVKKCLQQFSEKGFNVNDIDAVGISNQRETFVVWDEKGQPLHNAVVWQCKRSVDICERLKAGKLADVIKTKTGLLIDPYFSGTKLMWLYKNVNKVKEAVDNGKAYFGTIDSWLLFKLTDGKKYYTDYTNASRTMFFNLSTLTWDDGLLQTFGLSNLNLPACKPSSFLFGETSFGGLLDHQVSINGMIGDSHAAAFGEGCYQPGKAKATLGTGCSIMMNIGDTIKYSDNGMVTTICWSTEDKVQYALEGVIVSCGATIEWLKNELALFTDSKDTEQMATLVNDNSGVYIVPAFSGLGAPHWHMDRKASISGLTFNTGKNHIVRAALESIPYQVKDVIEAMEADTRVPLKQLMIDGGISANHFIVQFLADLLNKPVVNIGIPDVSALGAALLAGLQKGIFKSIDAIGELNTDKRITQPQYNDKMDGFYAGWKRAVREK